ncbi:nitrite reductase (NAD(P)H) small subunit [Rhodococcus sp. T2V]|uniref:Rieske (2Fe-2S) protein n=1 Tax=Rhodococcus sp. T2V TaxID=3034164 RepID=UPI0023E320FB|nr:Rieske 2Fe-2S domain-containing protein [Rhodococcus sp. T2V]MDF3311470.1 nitrite reductase (NAD(P)H) small subunit [Rhodococcus sp. T2V]
MIKVCGVDELTPGRPTAVRVEDTQVVLALWQDEVFAVRDACPHMGQSFECGRVAPAITAAEAGAEMSVDTDTPVLMCPWHTWGYSVRDGRCTTDPRLRVRTYPTVVEDGQVFVDVGGA